MRYYFCHLPFSLKRCFRLGEWRYACGPPAGRRSVVCYERARTRPPPPPGWGVLLFNNSWMVTLAHTLCWRRSVIQLQKHDFTCEEAFGVSAAVQRNLKRKSRQAVLPLQNRELRLIQESLHPNNKGWTWKKDYLKKTILRTCLLYHEIVFKFVR